MLSENLKVVSFSFSNFTLPQVGMLHLPDAEKSRRVYALMRQTGMSECMVLATCNRLEIISSLPHFLCPGMTAKVVESLYPEMEADVRSVFIKGALVFNGPDALRHLFLLASGLESKITGEREISGQIRKTYDEYNHLGCTGDLLRITISRVIRASKDIFTQTPLGTGSVSISSLCWQKLNDLGFDPQKPLVFLGAGEVISSLVKFFHDAGYTRLLFVNRTKERAAELSAIYGGDALSIDEFWLYREKMHLLISCTGATEVILTAERFDQFFEAGVAPEFMVDLANPADIDEAISDRKYVRMIRLAEIQEVAVKNLQLRRDLMDQCIPIIELHERELQDELRVRRVEIAMSAVPESVKEIRRQALEKVFLKEFNQLDESSRELMLRMLDYMERKYISVPMKLAKEVLLTNIDVN